MNILTAYLQNKPATLLTLADNWFVSPALLFSTILFVPRADSHLNGCEYSCMTPFTTFSFIHYLGHPDHRVYNQDSKNFFTTETSQLLNRVTYHHQNMKAFFVAVLFAFPLWLTKQNGSKIHHVKGDNKSNYVILYGRWMNYYWFSCLYVAVFLSLFFRFWHNKIASLLSISHL